MGRWRFHSNLSKGWGEVIAGLLELSPFRHSSVGREIVVYHLQTKTFTGAKKTLRYFALLEPRKFSNHSQNFGEKRFDRSEKGRGKLPIPASDLFLEDYKERTLQRQGCQVN